MFQYLGSTGSGSTYESECVEEEIELCAESEELREWDWRKIRRRLNGRGFGSGIVVLFFVEDVLSLLEGEPLLLDILEILLLIRYRWCGGHGWDEKTRCYGRSPFIYSRDRAYSQIIQEKKGK